MQARHTYYSSWIQVQTLIAENALYKECTGKSAAELELMSSKAVALEVSLSALRFQHSDLDTSTSTCEIRISPVLRMKWMEIPGKLYLGKRAHQSPSATTGCCPAQASGC